eukprot:Anaeramoba_ignava/a480533_12.p1 GENE.a480533_12~~a480533_12.p1  ORF type:complete len:220 (-),score=38.56 a480533_12:16-675(-)
MRYEKMSSFIVMDIVRDAQKYEDSIHFEIGQPDLNPTPKVKEGLKKALESDKFSYTESLGLLELREKIVKHYKKVYDVNIDSSQVLLTPGTSGAFLVAYTLTLKHKGKLGLSDPSYPCYKNFAHMLDIDPVFMNIDKSCDYQLKKRNRRNRRKRKKRRERRRKEEEKKKKRKRKKGGKGEKEGKEKKKKSGKKMNRKRIRIIKKNADLEKSTKEKQEND